MYIHIPYKKPGRPSNKPDDLRLIQMYFHEGYTSAQLAKMYGVSDSTVRTWVSNLRKAEARKAQEACHGTAE